MIILLTRPQAVKAPTTNVSKWSAVHNEIAYNFQRRDFSVSAITSGSGNRCRIQMLYSEASEIAIGHMIYVSSIGKTCKVVAYQLVSPFFFVTVDEQFDSSYNVAGYANNLTSRANYNAEIKIFAYNNQTNKTDVAGTIRLYPKEDGSIKVILNKWLLKYVSNKEESTYTQVIYNDKNAWVRFYIGYRQVWEGYEHESFYEDRTVPFLGENMLQNSKLTSDSSFFTLDGSVVWNGGGYLEKPASVVGVAGSVKPSNYLTFPTIAGKKYRIKFRWFDVSGIRTFSNTMRIYLDDEVFTNGVNQEAEYEGNYEVDLVAPVNGAFPTWSIKNMYYGSLDDLEMQVVNDEEDNTPRWCYANKAALQLWSEFDNNQANHVAFYDDFTLVPQHRAKFISDFEQPTFFVGYPFDIAILFDDLLQYVEVEKGEELFDRAMNTTLASPVMLPQTSAGEQRLRLQNTYNTDIKFVDVWLQTTGLLNSYYAGYVANEYVDEDYVTAILTSLPSYEGEITERRRVRISTKCYQNPVYLAWKGAEGGWNYWLFGRTQEISSNTSEQARIERYTSTLLTRANTSQASIKSVESWKLGVDNVDLNDIKGLMRLLDSGCVMMYLGTIPKLLTKQWLEVLIRTGSSRVYETGNGRHNFEFTIDLPYRYTHQL